MAHWTVLPKRGMALWTEMWMAYCAWDGILEMGGGGRVSPNSVERGRDGISKWVVHVDGIMDIAVGRQVDVIDQ